MADSTLLASRNLSTVRNRQAHLDAGAAACGMLDGQIAARDRQQRGVQTQSAAAAALVFALRLRRAHACAHAIVGDPDLQIASAGSADFEIQTSRRVVAPAVTRGVADRFARGEVKRRSQKRRHRVARNLSFGRDVPVHLVELPGQLAFDFVLQCLEKRALFKRERRGQFAQQIRNAPVRGGNFFGGFVGKE